MLIHIWIMLKFCKYASALKVEKEWVNMKLKFTTELSWEKNRYLWKHRKNKRPWSGRSKWRWVDHLLECCFPALSPSTRTSSSAQQRWVRHVPILPFSVCWLSISDFPVHSERYRYLWMENFLWQFEPISITFGCSLSISSPISLKTITFSFVFVLYWKIMF